ncbi:translation initiation factor IF-3 [Brassicibacter mesophilus]|uniref:translation initiation factor IF-3 n=1 Tax=Brassicibacter mesophilus TaxID=745119 RepID=UPI003D234708
MYNIIIRRCPNIKELQINEEIRDKEVRLIDVDGEQLGIVSSKRAQEIADEKKLDLVKIAPNAKPPVCRIMDFGKYKYELAKKEKEARKNQKVINIKEIRMTPSIEDNDLNVKAKKASQFLKDGDKVKVSVRFRGREMGHTDIGREVLVRFAELTSEYGVIDKQPKLEGRNMVMFLNPKN